MNWTVAKLAIKLSLERQELTRTWRFDLFVEQLSNPGFPDIGESPS
jgi:hypothetical protein